MILLTDLHLDCYKQWSTLENGVNSRLLDQIKVVDAVSALIESTGTENVLFLGDLINSFSDSLPKVVYNAVCYALTSWAKRARVYVIAGNHDIYRSTHIFDPYRRIENIEIVTSPVREYIEEYSVDLLPWGYPLPRMDDRAEVLAGHLEIKGATMNAAGVRSQTGIDYDKLKGYKFVFLGHYHEPQSFNIKGSAYAGYIGSVMQTDLSLSPQARGVVLFNCGRVSRRYIPSPKILTATVNTQEEADILNASLTDGNYWRVTVTDPGVSMPAHDHRVQIEYDIKPKTEARLEEKPGEDLKETVVRFLDSVETKVDKDLAKLIVDEVMS